MFSQEVEWLLGEKYQGEKTASFLADVEKLQSGEPLAYLIGHIPFLDTTIYLGSRPLIPRPETEFWVSEAITEIVQIGRTGTSPLHVLDLCAGSGCIGVAIAYAVKDVKMDFIEIDKPHLSTIEKNCRTNKLEAASVRIMQGSLFSVFDDINLPLYDFIITNPPYIDPVLDRAEKSVIEFEPAIALYGGSEGMEIIGKIILEAPLHLNKGGQLWIEHEPEQEASIKEMAAPKFITSSHKDQYGLTRFSKLVLQ